MLDTIRQILSDLFLDAAQEQWSQLGGEFPTRDPGGVLVFLRPTQVVHLAEMILVTEVVGLHEINDAPEVEHSVLDRGAGQGQLVVGLELLNRLSHLRAGVLDELRLIKHNGTKGELGQVVEITP